MNGKLKKKGLRKPPKQAKRSSREVIVKKRGRPKGSKNKPKEVSKVSKVLRSKAAQEKPKRGRPKGSKNKPKEPVPTPVVVIPEARPIKPSRKNICKPAPVRVEPSRNEKKLSEEHPLVETVKWLMKYMSPNELNYYRTRANRLNMPQTILMANDVLSIFNVQDNEIKKQIKTYFENESNR